MSSHTRTHTPDSKLVSKWQEVPINCTVKRLCTQVSSATPNNIEKGNSSSSSSSSRHLLHPVAVWRHTAFVTHIRGQLGITTSDITFVPWKEIVTCLGRLHIPEHHPLGERRTSSTFYFYPQGSANYTRDKYHGIYYLKLFFSQIRLLFGMLRKCLFKFIITSSTEMDPS
jgi:hypothetical protein